MTDTAINILKILYQTKITKENIAQNLDLKENTVIKSIIEINSFLKELNLKQIKVHKGILELDLDKYQWKKLFKKINNLTFQDEIDYLYIKFVYYRFLNLEKEKKVLDLSRSSINRCFLIIKKLLEENNSKIIYDHGKGNKLLELSEYNKNIFIIKVMKLILEEETLTDIQKELLNDIKNFITKIRFIKLISIFKCLNLPTTIVILSFLCALDVYDCCFEKNNKFIISEEEIENDIKLKKIHNIVNSIGSSFNQNYKNYLIFHINAIRLNKHYYLSDVLYKSNIVKEKIILKFNICDKNFKVNLLQHLYLGIFKKENNILRVRNIHFKNNEKILLNILNDILKDSFVELYSSDKYTIVNLLRKELVKIKIEKTKKILILLEEVNTLRQTMLKEELEIYFSNIEFEIRYNFLSNKKNYKKDFDFIINDSQIDLIEGDILDRIKNELETLIIQDLILNL